MGTLDWGILILYILLIIGMSAWLGKKQESREDYYLGGRRMPPWQISLSIVATQVSAISLIGAPAFVALKANGGLIWLQYEFAIPLAMMLIMLTLVPIYHRVRGITIYQYLEDRFGKTVRWFISMVFLISRGLGSGVALLATGIVTAVVLDWPLAETILLIGFVSIAYTTFGGIKADIYSDIIQLIILWGGSLLVIGVLITDINWATFSFTAADQLRLKVFDLSTTGLGDGNTFAFWPMLIGGFFLYLSYYGCDQSQAQRLLTTSTPEEAQKALLINGVLRFPLVLTYSSIGILMLPFLNSHPEFVSKLQGQQPDFLLPYFLIDYIPVGFLGLIIAGFFAASMSSLDSAMNSLSAATYQDFLIKIFPRLENLSNKQQIRLSRILTVFWGGFATVFALELIGGSETVIELVNKIGSAFYGPILAIFWLGMFTRSTTAAGAIIGVLGGVGTNIFLWQSYSDQVSWLWWNVIGFLVSFLIALAVSRFIKTKAPRISPELYLTAKDIKIYLSKQKNHYRSLVAWFVLIILFSWLLQTFLSRF